MTRTRTNGKSSKQPPRAGALTDLKTLLGLKIPMPVTRREKLLGHTLPSVEWLATTALELLKQTPGGMKGQPAASLATNPEAFFSALQLAHSLFESANSYLVLTQQVERKDYLHDVYRHQIVLPTLSKDECKRGRVTYARACKILTGEQKPKRAAERVARRIGKPTKQIMEEGLSIDELVRCHAKYSKSVLTSGTDNKRLNALKKTFTRALTSKMGRKP
jgi:hypothetical protein